MKNMGHYEGEWLNGLRHGFGVYVYKFLKQTWPDNSVYEG